MSAFNASHLCRHRFWPLSSFTWTWTWATTVLENAQCRLPGCCNLTTDGDYPYIICRPFYRPLHQGFVVLFASPTLPLSLWFKCTEQLDCYSQITPSTCISWVYSADISPFYHAFVCVSFSELSVYFFETLVVFNINSITLQTIEWIKYAFDTKNAAGVNIVCMTFLPPRRRQVPQKPGFGVKGTFHAHQKLIKSYFCIIML